MYRSKTRPAVHPNGDIYFVDHDADWVYLYKIPNTWDTGDTEEETTEEEDG